MTKPVTIPNTFATATTAIPLSQLDSDFSTVATALNDANTYSNYAADTGVANAYVVTLTGVSTTYSAGLRIQFKAGNANTGASTLNVNGGGTKNITFQDASALSSGTIAANAIVDVMYDGTQFLLMNDPAGTVGTGDVVGPVGATANAAAIFDSTTGKLIKDSKVIITPVANSSTLTIANNKTVTVNNTLTLSGTDSTTMTFPSTSATIARTDSAQTFTGVQTFSSNPVLDGGTANGVLYLNGSKVATSGSALTFDGTNFFLNTGYMSFNSNGYIRADSANNKLTFQAGSSGYLWKDNNNSGDWMALTSTGLGIGTSSPSVKLQVSKSGAGIQDIAWLNNSQAVGTDVGSQLSFTGTTNNNGLAAIGGAFAGATTADGGYMFFSTRAVTSGTLTERARITSGGDFRVKGAGTAGSTEAFQVSGSAPADAARLDSSGNLLVGTTSASLTADNGIKLNADNRLSVVNSGSVEGFIYYNTAASAYRFYVSGNGTISATNTTISAISDQRFKENVQDLDVGLDAVMALKPRKFDWKAGKGKDIKGDRGWIAQEFEQVFPDMIDTWKDEAPEGEEPYKSVRADLIPVLVKAIQEQQALITSLTARVAALEGTQP